MQAAEYSSSSGKDDVAQDCIPAMKPSQEEDLNRIEKLVAYIIRNGLSFQDMIKNKEKDNPQFSFLFDGKDTAYYQWRLLCTLREYSDRNILQIKQQHASRLLTLPTGALSLISSDKNVLRRLLQNNTGSKECIRALREFIIARAHSGAAVGIELKLYAGQLVSPSIETDPEMTTNVSIFTKLLHLIYVINDVLFNRATATFCGPYTEFIAELNPSWTPPSVDYVTVLLPQIHQILSMAYLSTNVPTDKEKLGKLIDLWLSKKFITDDQAARCRSVMTSEPPVAMPPDPILFSPYILNLPPKGAPELLEQPAPHLLTPAIPHPPMHSSQPPNFHPPNSCNPPMGMPPGPHGLPPRPLLPQGFQATSLPILDLRTVPVGIMANIIRNVLQQGHEPYTPLSHAELSRPLGSPLIEPGRLEARVLDFYRKIEKSESNSTSTPQKSSAVDIDGDEQYHRDAQVRKRSRSDSMEFFEGKWRQDSPAPPSSSAPTSIPNDNIGHQMLRGLGWQDGKGLGQSSTGIVDPVQASEHTGRFGVGGGDQLSGRGLSNDNDYSSYRGSRR
mmetsp:Transcript_15933/g.26690  ORF Transcript_15933/g.26690 Transcript_15933/m.26690 type:complete len:559 (+) Transcript_15933:175-1851(+)